RAVFEREILPNYLPGCRWFGAKARTLREMKITENPTLASNGRSAQLWFVEVSYPDGPTETYALPVTIASGEAAGKISQTSAHAVIVNFEDGSVLYDAVWD